MPFDREHGCATPGTNGRATHHGAPLTVDQIRELPDGAEVVITWSGGNGPHPYRILVHYTGDRCIEAYDYVPLLHPWPPGEQQHPGHRVTLGWDDQTRAWYDRRVPPPAHTREMWRRLRGQHNGAGHDRSDRGPH